MTDPGGLGNGHVPRQGAVDAAAKHLEELIDLRRVLPGLPLPAASQVAEAIGVNRTAVLQAFQLLRREGLITVRRGRGGARVIARDDRPDGLRLARALSRRDGIEQAAVLREIVDAGIARIAAERSLTASAATRARDLVRRMRRTADRDVYLSLDTEFHDILVDATGSDMLRRLAVALRQLFLVGLDAVDLPDERRHGSDHEHERLLAAVLRGSGSSAADWAHRHAAGSRGLLTDVLELLDRIKTDARTTERVG